jgi:DNA mismatch repair protein MutH
MSVYFGENDFELIKAQRLGEYQDNCIKSIQSHAEKLNKKSLNEIYPSEMMNIPISKKDKGYLGKLVEIYHFGIKPNNNPEPDFPKVNLELKTTGLTEKNKAKERLSLSMINYHEIVNQTFEDFLKKNSKVLIIFYQYKKNEIYYKMKFAYNIIIDFHSLPESDKTVIKADWKKIVQAVKDAKAHEISGGDTFYLKADTKGCSGGMQSQPFSDIKAKPRAFCFPGSYLSSLIKLDVSESLNQIYGKIIKNSKNFKDIEGFIISKFKSFYNLSCEDIEKLLGVTILNNKAKNYYANLSKGILGIDFKQKIEEFEKGNICVKTIRVEEDNSIEQSVSFSAFKFIKLCSEDWEDSETRELFEQRFIFIFYKKKNSEYFLEKVKFWNMPYTDRGEVRKVWLKTKELLNTGKIVKSEKSNINGKTITYNFFPKKSENKVCHVRPHGSTKKETYELPVIEKTTGAKKFTKQCFWINHDYIRDEVYLK